MTKQLWEEAIEKNIVKIHQLKDYENKLARLAVEISHCVDAAMIEGVPLEVTKFDSLVAEFKATCTEKWALEEKLEWYLLDVYSWNHPDVTNAALESFKAEIEKIIAS